jgi:hypothetical protein
MPSSAIRAFVTAAVAGLIRGFSIAASDRF